MATGSKTTHGATGSDDHTGSDVKHHENIRLKRHLGLLHGVGVVSGLITGAGIYVAPNGIMDGSGSAGLALILWITSGLAAILGALCFAELGTTFPASGEKYAYLQEMYGPFAAFIYLWMYLLFKRPGSNAIKVLLFGHYTLLPFYLSRGCPVDQRAVNCLAVCLPCKLVKSLVS